MSVLFSKMVSLPLRVNLNAGELKIWESRA